LSQKCYAHAFWFCTSSVWDYNVCVIARHLARRLLVPFLALALLAVLLVLVLRPPSAPYLALLRRGDALAAEARRTAAVAAYEEAARLRPEEPIPYLRLAQVYLVWGRVEEALGALSQAERLDAAAAVGMEQVERLWIAAYAADADWPALIERARRLLAGSPDDRAARHALARAYVEMQEWDAARKEYETLLQSDPDDSLAHERLGILRLGDDFAAARHLLVARTELADRLLSVLKGPGVAENPAYACALLGRVLFEAEEWALAARQFERALAYDADYSNAHAYLGHALDQMERPDQAEPHLLRAVALDPDSVVARMFLGLYYERRGALSTARAEYEAAYDLDPENPAACIEIGQAWAAEGRYLAAEIWFLEAVSLQPDDPLLWKVLTRFYLNHNINARGQGVEAAQRLLELSPDDARAHDLRGWAAILAGDYDTAQESLRRAVSLDPALASAHYHLGLLWKARGDRQKAREAFIRALDLDVTGEIVPLVERAMGGRD